MTTAKKKKTNKGLIEQYEKELKLSISKMLKGKSFILAYIDTENDGCLTVSETNTFDLALMAQCINAESIKALLTIHE